jgi:hypothetical protein
MLRSGLSKLCIMGSIVLSLAWVESASGQTEDPPDLSGTWLHGRGVGIGRPVPGSPSPITQDPNHYYTPGQGDAYRIGDLTNPNLMPWAKEVMQKDTDEIDAGKIAFQSSSSCLPSGIPLMFSYPNPLMIVQSADKVVMLKEQGMEVRHIYLNVPHSENPTPSWYGESVGHYEGDTLVVDTIGLNADTFIDVYRTPHTEKLHVVERWRKINNGEDLELILTVDDPGTFYKPWTTRMLSEREHEPFLEFVCAENNQNFGLFDFSMPVATKADF